LKTDRVVKIHNLSIRQAALEFNINYHALLQKIPVYYISTLEHVIMNPEYEIKCHIFTILFQIK